MQRIFVDGIPVFVNDVDVLEQPVCSLALGDVGSEQHQLVRRRNLGLQVIDRNARSFGQVFELGVDVFVGGVEAFGGCECTQCHVDLDGADRRLTHLFHKAADVLAHHLEVLLEANAALGEALRHVFDPVADLGLDERLRCFFFDQVAELACGQVVPHVVGLFEALLAKLLDDVVAEVFDGLEVAGVADEFVGQLGQDHLLDVLDRDDERKVAVFVGCGVCSVERDFVADRCTVQVVIELRDEAAAANAVGVVAGGEAFDFFAVVGRGDVHGHGVAFGGGTFDRGELAELATEAIDASLDVVVARFKGRNFDRHALVATDLDRGSNLDYRFKGEVAIFFAAGDFVFRRADDVDLMFGQGVHEVLRDAVLKGLATCDAGAELGLEHFAWNFALAEARHTDIARNLFEGLVDLGLELSGVDLDRQLYAVVVELFNSRLHWWECTERAHDRAHRTMPEHTAPKQGPKTMPQNNAACCTELDGLGSRLLRV